jgi:sigma-B regulation protein RsbU (phosphoserine phosphatase)
VTALAIEGLPLGVMPDTEYTPKTAQMGPNSALLLYTDGLTDIRNSSGVNYGSRKLKAWLKNHATRGLGATDLANQLASELNQFRGDAAMDDDQAFLVLTEDGTGSRQAPTSARRIFQRSGSFLFPAAAGTST